MFDLIAPRYDRFTRVFSLGMDAGWKRELIGLLAASVGPSARVLDLACGTGDLAFAAATYAPSGETIAIDASRRMVDAARLRARREPAGAHVRFAVGDLAALDMADASVDAVTAGYALRNVPDHRLALGEIARVLRPGGTLLTLDFYRPESALWRAMFLSYLTIAGNAFGWMWHREPVVYGYIARSIAHYVSWRAFARSLREAGFTVLDVRRKLHGGVAIHHARRAE